MEYIINQSNVKSAQKVSIFLFNLISVITAVIAIVVALILMNPKLVQADAITCPHDGNKLTLSTTGSYGASRGSRSHAGIDIGLSTGAPLYAVRSGIITRSSVFGAYGLTVDLKSNDYTYRYAHLQRFAVGSGSYVNAGDLIGYVNSSGGDYDPHLHWEARTDNGANGYFSGTVDPTGLYNSCISPGSTSLPPSTPSPPPSSSVNPDSCNDPHPTLRSGSSDRNCVAHLQRYLEKHGYSLSPFGVDGDFGSLTKRKLQDFQKNMCISADGVAGPQTWSKLHSPESECGQSSSDGGGQSASLSKPSLSSGCSGTTSIVNISWNNPGILGVKEYIVDIDDDNFRGGWWNKKVGLATSTSAPGGFNFYPPPGFGLRFEPGNRYDVRIFFSGPNEHTTTASFIARDCSQISDGGSDFILRGVESGRCLDIADRSQSRGANVQIWGCSGAPNQLWTFYADGTIRAYQGSKCLDVQFASRSNGGNVHMWDCHFGDNQIWRYNSDGTISIYGGSKCLDVNKSDRHNNFGLGDGANVTIYDCHRGSNQQWKTQ